MPIFLLLVLISCQTVTYTKEIDKKKSIYYLYTHEQIDGLTKRRKLLLQKVRKKLLVDNKQLPTNIKTLLDLAQVSFLLGEYRESIDYCRKILKIDITSTQARVIMAKNFLKQKNYQLAKTIIDQLGDHEQIEVANLKAQTAIAEENYREAFGVLKAGLAKHSNSTVLLMNLGLICLRFRQLVQARDYFERVLVKVNDHPDALLHLAIIDTLQKKYYSAEKKYRKLLSVEQDPSVLFNLSVLKSKTHSYQEALQAMQKYGGMRNGLLPDEQQFWRDLQKKMQAKQKITNADIDRLAATIDVKETHN